MAQSIKERDLNAYDLTDEMLNKRDIILTEFCNELNSEIDVSRELLVKNPSLVAFWKCTKDHITRESLNYRMFYKGCRWCNEDIDPPKYAGRKNPVLLEHDPDIFFIWNYQENYPLAPDSVTTGKKIKLTFWCPIHGEYYSQGLQRKAMGSPGCRKCKIKEKRDKNIKYWRDKNGSFLEKLHELGQNDKSNPLFLAYQELFYEWQDNSEYGPDDLCVGSSQMVKWKCRDCGYKWETALAYRTSSDPNGCKRCNTNSYSNLQIFIYCELKTLFGAENVKMGDKSLGPEIDVLVKNLKLGIEVDGWHHRNRIEQDVRKNKVLDDYGIRLIRVRDDRLPEIDGDIVKYSTNRRGVEYYLELLQSIIRISNISNPKLERYLTRSSPLAPKEYAAMASLTTKISEEDSLEFKYPEIASELDKGKHPKVDTKRLSIWTDLEFWWTCRICGYSFRDKVRNRTTRLKHKKTGPKKEGYELLESNCPCCRIRYSELARREKLVRKNGSFFEVFKDSLMNFWDHEKNSEDGLNPKKIPPKNTTAKDIDVNWWCKSCDHKWKAPLTSRAISTLKGNDTIKDEKGKIHSIDCKHSKVSNNAEHITDEYFISH